MSKANRISSSSYNSSAAMRNDSLGRKMSFNIEKSPPKNYFKLPIMILLITGMYPINSDNYFIVRFLYSFYTWFVYFFIIILNPITKIIVLPSLTNIDDITDTISFLVNHIMAVAKIAVFMIKKKDLLRLVELIQGHKFRHRDCGKNFSANRLISEAVKTTNIAYSIFFSFVVGLVFNSILSASLGESEEIMDFNNYTESSTTNRRALPFHSWYPFNTDKSPIYEFVFVYQIIGVIVTAQTAMALDTMVVGFMIHIKVQFKILSHNLRFIKSHAEDCRKNISPSVAATVSQRNLGEIGTDNLIKTIELDLEKQISHHRAIIQMTKDLESVFTYQLLLQFLCSLFAACTLLWQVSSTPVLSAKFGTMLSYLGAVTFQLFMYCWFGNEMMLESLSVAEAAWDSGWDEILSRRYCHGVAMIILRSQKVIKLTAGGFADLTLETFMTISRAAYSCFALLKKVAV